ncbi:hypothetical protein P7C71_g5015, partial [Lecanoromycetidae sp. Uapishka_2]
MGVTGAGKSSFIQQCVPAAKNIVGEDYDSFTRDCIPYPMTFEGRKVFLIDTPGFNDSSVRDVDILNDLAGWLAKSYEESIRLNGLIYLHGIQDARMTGSDRMHLTVFKRLTGLENMSHVVLATSFWDVTDHAKGEHRENQLITRDDFWKKMKDAGAAVIRFKNDSASAMEMVKFIVDQNEKTVLKIQVEMEDGRTVRNTGAGQTLEEDISDRVKGAEKELEKRHTDLLQAMKDENEQAAQEALDAQERLKAQMKELKKTKNKLDVTTEELIKQKDAEIQRAKEEAERLRLEQEKAGEEHKRELSAKDKEANARVEQNDREWQQGLQMLTDKLGEFAQGIAANSGGSQQPLQGQKPALTEERVEEMFHRVTLENRIKELEAQKAKDQSPPPYPSAAAGPLSNQQPPQFFPQPVYYPPPSHSHDAELGAVAGGMGALAFASMCSVM